MTQIKIIKNVDLDRMEDAVNRWLQERNGKIHVISVEIGSFPINTARMYVYISTILYEVESGVLNG